MKASAPDTGRRLHAVLTGLCWLVPVGSAVYILCVYGGMPAVVGYHFAADGAFDLFGRKDVPGMWVGENKDARFWVTVLNSLRNRGVMDVFTA